LRTSSRAAEESSSATAARQTDCLQKLYLPYPRSGLDLHAHFLLKLPEVDVTHSSVALREIKTETALPL